MLPLGLIAGGGGLPFELARAARERGRRVQAVAFPGTTDPRLAREVHGVAWHAPGAIAAATESLLGAGAAEAVLAGSLPKASWIGPPESLDLDASARALLAAQPERGDTTLLAALARYLEGRGIRLLPQAELVPGLLAPGGPLTRRGLSDRERADVACAWPIARELAARDVGQTVVVRDGAVLAVEAVEGTDAAIERGGRFAAGSVVVKVARPDQDPRWDLPAVGPATLAALVSARASALAVQAGRTLVLEREELARRAEAAGIAVVGIER